jgi:iron complex outermembrane recepter protein
MKAKLLLTSAMFLSLPTISAAQDIPLNQNDDSTDTADIIVTGTLLRGVAPTGSQIQRVDAAEIATQGITTTSQILQSIASDVNFNSRPQVGAYQAFQTVNRPTLRYLGASNSGGSSTLVLLDGHRMPGMGIYQTTPDLDAIAPGAIASIDTVTGGGSSIYGSDAVGGVMNIITRRKFDGAEVSGHFGFADDFYQWDASATIGKNWERASLWATYSYAYTDMLLFGDRDYARNWDYINNVPNDTRCSPGNIQVGANFIPLTANGTAAGAANPIGNRCDTFLNRAYFPEMSRHSAMAGLDVELSDAISFDVRAFYAHRDSTTANTATDYSIAGAGGQILGNLSPTFGPSQLATSTLNTWGVTPRFTVKLGSDWQAIAFYNYGEGISKFTGNGYSATDLLTAYRAGNFDPLTGTFPNTPGGQAALAAQRTRFSLSRGEHRIHNARLSFDGPLISLPGGEVRVAGGGEILHEEYNITTGSGPIGTALRQRANDRTIKSLFGEVSIPLFGADNAAFGLRTLTLSGSGRYDDYEDFGDTFNPKFGLTWVPVEGLTIRGNWSKSYQAPSLAERFDVSPSSLAVYPAMFFPNPAFPAGTKQDLILYPGSSPTLGPQKATTWEAGADLRPAAIPGLSLSGTYYSIDFKGRIGNPPFFNPAVFYPQFTGNYIMFPTAAQIAAHVAQASVGAEQAAPYLADPSLVYALIDARSTNLSSVKTTGIDFNLNYTRKTSFGSIFGQVSGTYVATYDVLAFVGGPTSHRDANAISPLRLQAMLGTKVGDFFARATLQHTSGYEVAASPAALNQTEIGSFNVVNFAFSYDINGASALKDVQLTLNVDNAFDQDPPRYNGVINTSLPGFSGFTLGRMVQLGLRKRF